jgi:hypothetical protein
MRIENSWLFKLDDNGKKAKIDIKKLTLTRKWRRQLMFKLILFTALANKRFFADPEKKKYPFLSSILIRAIKLPYFDERYNLKCF